MSTKKTKLRAVKGSDAPPVELPAECCAKCTAFLDEVEATGQGLCRSGPPTPVWTGLGVSACFAPMLPQGWCRAFIPIVTAVN